MQKHKALLALASTLPLPPGCIWTLVFVAEASCFAYRASLARSCSQPSSDTHSTHVYKGHLHTTSIRTMLKYGHYMSHVSKLANILKLNWCVLFCKMMQDPHTSLWRWCVVSPWPVTTNKRLPGCKQSYTCLTCASRRSKQSTLLAVSTCSRLCPGGYGHLCLPRLR